MKNLLSITLIAILFTSCIGKKTINDIVKEQYAKTNSEPFDNQNYSITNQFDNDSLVKTKKIKSMFIPAILYWGFSSTLSTEFNNIIPVNLINNHAYEYANAIEFKTKLKGKKIYLNFKSLPKKFELKQSNNTLFVFFSVIITYKNNIKQDDSNLELEYKIVENENEIKSGTIIITNQDFTDYKTDLSGIKNCYSILNNCKSKSTKVFVKNYLNFYEEKTKILSKIIIDKLSEKL